MGHALRIYDSIYLVYLGCTIDYVINIVYNIHGDGATFFSFLLLFEPLSVAVGVALGIRTNVNYSLVCLELHLPQRTTAQIERERNVAGVTARVLYSLA